MNNKVSQPIEKCEEQEAVDNLMNQQIDNLKLSSHPPFKPTELTETGIGEAIDAVKFHAVNDFKRELLCKLEGMRVEINPKSEISLRIMQREYNQALEDIKKLLK